jgi:carbamoyl-phosphate synthase small subunit
MQGKLPITNTAKTRPARRSERGVFFKTESGRLDLADGMTFFGKVPHGQMNGVAGEVVFNTGMTGYTESLTDPSYAGQILVFTYPLIGNYGIDEKSMESNKIQVSGVVVSEASRQWSHSGSDRSLLDWLQSQNVPILMDVDTRSLTKHLRVEGSMAGMLGTKLPKAGSITAPKKFVSVDKPVTYNETSAKKVILVDCGSKENILRSLLEHDVQVKRVPHDYDYTNEDYDGVLLSNGPGDPTDYEKTIAVARKAMEGGKPIFGICLGNQIMGLAAGAMTYKLKYGHRGHNQPCLESNTDRGFITSQNHGYAIDENSLPKGWKVSYTNLNDGSVEGIEHTSKPFFSVQFHPEACPGPTDTAWLFERFFTAL